MRVGPVRDALMGVPGAMAVGAGRAFTANSVNPGFKGLSVSKSAWIFDAVGLGVGLTGLFLGDEVYEWTESVLQSSLAYATEDATHEVVRVTGKSTAATTPTSVASVRTDLVATLPPAPGTATETYYPEPSLEGVA